MVSSVFGLLLPSPALSSVSPQLLWLAYLPLPNSPTDIATSIFFLGIVGIIAWNVYTTGRR